MATSESSIAIIGMGPRGLSVLERVCANAGLIHNSDIKVHAVDPYPAGAGNVWRTDQSKHLLMNTVASQITLFTDPSVDCKGPHLSGPSLYEWARFLVLINFWEKYDESVLEEARKLDPDSYPTRAFYGHYLKWVYQLLIRNTPNNVTIHSHQARAVSLDDAPDGRQIIRLDDGSEPLNVNAVVLALGHTPTILSNEERRIQNFADKYDLCYIAPANPADVNLDRIEPGKSVILRGLGLNFFDYMALLTVGRGGRFIRNQGRLMYESSGREPKMYASSRRGIPYHARGENQKGPFGRHDPLFLTLEVINNFRTRSNKGERINFRQEVWPFIAKEVETVYYTTLISSTSCNCQGEKFKSQYRKYSWGSEQEQHLLDEFGVDQTERWNWERLSDPHSDKSLDSQQTFRAWLVEYLRRDLTEARRGNVSGPLKAALDVLRDLRNEVRLIVDHEGISGDSYRDDLQGWYTSLNAFLSIGPPASRIEEMIALIETGILNVLGPGMHVELIEEPPRFRASSRWTNGNLVEATGLIEARLPDIDIRRTTDPLLSYLMQTGQARPFVISNSFSPGYITGGLAVTTPPNHIENCNGIEHPRRFAFGVPTEGVHWVTAAGIRPGVNSVTLSESDAIARAMLNLLSRDIMEQATPTKNSVPIGGIQKT